MSNITISPGQGLLLLISHYKNDPEKVAKLKKIYLSGTNDKNEDSITTLLSNHADNVLSHYKVEYDMDTINEDPTRRYFETHLSYATLKHESENQMITLNDLEAHIKMLIAMIPPGEVSRIQHVLDGELRNDDTDVNKEYSYFISKLKSHNFQDLPLKSIEKMELLAKSAFLGVINAQQNPQKLPLDIYHKGIYEQKGKIKIEKQGTTRNQNMGIMKAHMPLAQDDVALSDVQFPYLKPSDQAGFHANAEWVKNNFEKLVHPFSNSISGTMLCQLRSLAKFARDDQLNDHKSSIFTESQQKMAEFCKLLTSTMLFGSGGHTLNEFTAVLSLPEVKKEFHFIYDNTITMDSLFNSPKGAVALEEAIKKTIDYNARILLKAELHSQIQGDSPLISTESKPVLLNLRSNQLNQLINELREDASKLSHCPRSKRNDVLPVQTLITNGDYISAILKMEALEQLLQDPEEGVDYSEEDLEFLAEEQRKDQLYFSKLFTPLKNKIQAITALKDAIVHQKERFARFKDEMTDIKTEPTPIAETTSSIETQAHNMKNT